MCGGTYCSAQHVGAAKGLSPRVRGNRLAFAARGERNGSIPACAGEPFENVILPSTERVYPRVCGGTLPPTEGLNTALGLSPRVRGNRCISPARSPAMGSIPACAGEPCCALARGEIGWVYPRVCGGTAILSVIRYLSWGLSPRVRGNQSAGS